MPNEKKYYSYPSNEKDYKIMLADLQKKLAAANLSPKERLKIELGFEEAVVNVLSYSKSPEIYIAFSQDKAAIIIDIIDFGTPFNPLVKKPKPLAGSLEQQTEGGLGIFFLKKIFKLSYSYEKFLGKMANHLTMLYNMSI